MAAYAALVSLMRIIEQIEHHPSPPISLDKQHVESLTKNATFMQEFLLGYSPQVGYREAADGLEMRIADAAHAAEDVIESHIVDQILANQRKVVSCGFETRGKKICFFNCFPNRGLHKATSCSESIHSVDFHRRLEDVIEHMRLIKKEAMEIKAELGAKYQLQQSCWNISSGPVTSANSEQRLITVGLDDALHEMLDKLTRGQPDRQFIPIVGMGGIGKTTLGRKVYEHKFIAHHFHILAWITISHVYSMRALLEVACVEIMGTHRESVNEMGEDDLGEKLYKHLWGERYLIIMDDVWDIEVCDRLKLFFPNNRNGSRIMVTTRLANLAFQLSNSYSLDMKFLDEDASWNLLCKIVFGNESCPTEMVGIGKTIARNCSGLPLSIVVIGGLLAKAARTREYWDYISQDLSSTVNSDDNDHCLRILHTSYRQLPVYLKPCFLYMGIFPKNRKIRVSRLIKQLVGEGFVKPISGKSYEEVAEGYIKELIDRNLILVDSYGCGGTVKVCKMHDLLRDLCLKEAGKHKFFSVLTEQSLRIPLEMISERRCVCIYNKRESEEEEEEEHRPEQVFESAWFARSLIWEFQPPLPSFTTLRLLRVCSIADEVFPEPIFEQVNLRYIKFIGRNLLPTTIPSSISLLWNLETLVVDVLNAIIPSQIWKMPLIRHVVFSRARLPHPPIDGDDVLENLQTLENIHSFQCSQEVVKRIPNIKKLKIYYEDFFTEEGARNCISNLGRLHKLESLGIVIDPFPDVEKTQRHLVQNLTFPHSLKKLSIGHTRLHWEHLTTKIGSLPLLQVLKLKWQSFVGPKWETVEGNFCSLKFLLLEYCDLEHWATDNTHFPRLERIVLRDLPLLQEIDSSMGDIPTLRLIELKCCTKSVVISAKTLLEEQEDYGNVSIQVRVLLSEKDTALESLATSNFQFY